jgi:lipoate-protein ligase A
MNIENENWFLWDDGARPPQENMDVDLELLKKSVPGLSAPIVRFYDWDRPSVTIGYVKKPEAVPERARYTVVKRPTGGGIVYHDNEFTYSVVAPASHWISELDRVESYHVIHRVIVRALAGIGLECLLSDTKDNSSDRATMRCFTTPTKYDVLALDAAGAPRKVAGAAQRRTREGILHQGSISLEIAVTDKKTLGTLLVDAFQTEFDMVFTPWSPE